MRSGIVYEKDTLTLSWIGDGFLYHMVRILTGITSGCGNRKDKSGRDTGDSESKRPEEIWFSGTCEGTVFRPCFLYRSGA